MDCSPPGFSVHGISQARILEWVAFSSSSGSSWSRDQTFVSFVSCIGVQILYHWPTGEAQTNNHCTLMKLESSWRKSIFSTDTKIKYQKHTVFTVIHISYFCIHVLVPMAFCRKLCRKRKVVFPSQWQIRYFAFWVSNDVLRAHGK